MMKASAPFCVTTYNVLAQAYVRSDRYPDSPPDALDAKRRRALLVAELEVATKSGNADVLCLQECEPALFSALALPDFKRSYAQRQGRPDGCATFVRRTMFDVEGFEILRYRAHDGGHELALVANVHNGGKRLFIANTHLRWQKRETKPVVHLGRRQLEELMALSARSNASMSILCGDLNDEPGGTAIDAAVRAQYRLAAENQRPWHTALIGRRAKKLDYQLLRGVAFDSRPRALPKLDSKSVLPSLTMASDHLPLSVDYVDG